MTLSFLYLYLCSLFLSITAVNDWDKPCFSSVCEYDLPSTNGRSSGTLTIWGPSGSIGDITPAAGWAILDCSLEALKQTIRMACIDEGSSNCAHLFGNTTNLNDAVGKVVRLPETCGENPFGIVTKATLHEDQSIPVSMVSSLTRRDGTLPIVHGLHISTNVADWGSTGQNVHFAIRASNIHMPSIQRRGLRSFVHHVIEEIKSANDFDKDESINVTPIDINQNFTLIDQTISCPTFSAGVSIHVDTKSYASMTFDIAASGTIVPPKVNSISLSGSIIANMDSVVDVKSNIAGTLDIGEIKLYEAGLPGLNISGILSIRPSFIIAAKATATLDSQVGMKIGINYNISQTSFSFPHHNQPGGGSVKLGDTPLKITTTPSVNTTGARAVSIHLIPSFNFAIGAFGEGVNVFVNVDSSVSASLAVTPKEKSNQLPRDEPLLARKIDLANHPSVVARDDPGSLDGGCFEVDTGLSVNVGADTDFFNLFNVNTQIQLYTQSFQLFKKCFGSSSPKRSLPSRRGMDVHREMARKLSFNLQCFPLSSLLPLTIVDSIIPSTSITLI